MATETKARTAVPAAVGALMVLCCLAGPAVVGAVADSAMGGWLGILAAVVVAPTAIRRRSGRPGRGRSSCRSPEFVRPWTIG
jgi:hypothetical protein